MRRQHSVFICAAAPAALAACVSAMPITEPNLRVAIEQANAAPVQCKDGFTIEMDPEIILVKQCAGPYPAHLGDMGIEGKCLVRLNIKPDGSTQPDAAACNVDTENRAQLSAKFSRLAKQAFEVSAMRAAADVKFQVTGSVAERGRTNVILPIHFLLEGGDGIDPEEPASSDIVQG